jgi:hypothetical protein
VPGTLEAAVVFTLVIAPGYLLVRGFRVGWARATPDRDLYVLAEAVVASVVWLAVAYLLLRPHLRDLGLLPMKQATIERHGSDVAWLLLAVVLTPYVLGRGVGRIAAKGAGALGDLTAGIDRRFSPDRGWAAKAACWCSQFVGRSAILTLPTAWDRAWAVHRTRRRQVTVLLDDGIYVRGRVDRVDTTPLPHQVVLAEGEGFDRDGNGVGIARGPGGVYIESTEIRAVFFD